MRHGGHEDGHAQARGDLQAAGPRAAPPVPNPEAADERPDQRRAGGHPPAQQAAAVRAEPAAARRRVHRQRRRGRRGRRRGAGADARRRRALGRPPQEQQQEEARAARQPRRRWLLPVRVRRLLRREPPVVVAVLGRVLLRRSAGGGVPSAAAAVPEGDGVRPRGRDDEAAGAVADAVPAVSQPQDDMNIRTCREDHHPYQSHCTRVCCVVEEAVAASFFLPFSFFLLCLLCPRWPMESGKKGTAVSCTPIPDPKKCKLIMTNECILIS